MARAGQFFPEEGWKVPFLSFRARSLSPPDDQTGASLNGRFKSTQSRLFARAVGNQQNVVSMQGYISCLSFKDGFDVHGNLHALTGSRVGPQNLRAPPVSGCVQPIGARE